LLIGKPSTKECLQKAIDGETYEYTEMYPQFESIAKAEHNIECVKEFNEQGRESNEHAQQFKALLVKAQKRFDALKKVEERHANAYKKVLGDL
jgi:rubrerythrin